MGTPWTMTRSIRWRMRDWASCFLACRFPLDEDHSSAPQIPIRKMNRHKNEDNNKGNNKTNNHKRQSRSRHKKDTDTTVKIEAQSGIEEPSWPHFEDEDYIVFCFRDDGAIDVVKESKSESTPSETLHCLSASLRPSRRKSIYSETINEAFHENVSHEEGNDIFLTSEGEIIPAKENGKADTESPTCENGKRFQIEDTGSRLTVSVESTDSNQSEGSTGSFSFPVLGFEWMGSPVQMPRSESFRLRKHKGRCVRFQCCRF